MKDVRAECAVIVVMFWIDYLNSNRESWLKESQAGGKQTIWKEN